MTNSQPWRRCGRDRMVLDTTLCDNICQ